MPLLVGANPNQVTVKRNPGRKAEDVCWRPRLHHAVDVKHTTAGYTEQNAVDFLLYHLEGAAG